MFEHLLHIPVTRFQKAILTRELGPEWVIKRKHYLGQLLLLNLNKRRTRKAAANPQTTYKITIPHQYVNQYGFKNIEEGGAIEFLDFAEKMFREKLFSFLDARLILRDRIGAGKIKVYGLQIKDGIIEFCEEMGVSEQDVPLETLKKAYLRYRVKEESHVVLNKKYFSRKLSRPHE